MRIYQDRSELLRQIPKDGVCVEVGVFLGQFSKDILCICQPKHLFLVDKFKGHASSGDEHGKNIIKADMGFVYQKLIWVYKNAPNVHLVKCLSTEFLSCADDNSLDFVYLDADHSERAVTEELELCWKKVRNGGFISGHDYSHTTGVMSAVSKFIYKYNQELLGRTRCGQPSFLIQVKK